MWSFFSRKKKSGKSNVAKLLEKKIWCGWKAVKQGKTDLAWTIAKEAYYEWDKADLTASEKDKIWRMLVDLKHGIND